jgi:flavin reductase (DIM6/NTAB) family NADH-FMN oxidoreductase RutF
MLGTMLFVMSAGALLTPLEVPPVLNSPTYSLATLNEDGTTNMNILTYATPAGVSPRLWAVSLYRPTQTHANWLKRRSGVLQLLSEPHAPLAYALGGQSGAEVDKAAACSAEGFPWTAPAQSGFGDDAREQLLPGCVAYIRLTQVGDPTPCGEHDLVVCRVEAVLADPSGPSPAAALSTATLRAAGLITDRGRAVEP